MSSRILLSGAVVALALTALAFLHGRHAAPSALQRDARSPVATATHPVTLSMRAPASGTAAVEAVPRTVRQSTGDEDAFMSDLRALSEMDAELAVERAREGAARFGTTADAPERWSILIHALSSLGRASDARGEAERMVNDCPDSPWVREVERFTGAHRHRNLRLAANGELEYW